MREEIERGMSWVQTILTKVVEFFVNYSFEVIGALIILALGFKLSQWAGRAVVRLLERRKLDMVLARFAAGTVKGLIFGFAVIVALGKFGITIAPIIAAVGALAFGSTLALQGILSNFGSGLSLLFFRPFHVGDTITVKGVSGVVEELTFPAHGRGMLTILRAFGALDSPTPGMPGASGAEALPRGGTQPSQKICAANFLVKLGCTILADVDGERITVPNRHIIGEIVHNSFAYHIVESAIGISYHDDPQRAIGVITAALERFPDVAKTPPAVVGIQAFGDSAITIGLRYWVPTKRYFRLSCDVNIAVYTALKAANITIPFPQREVRILSDSSGKLG